MKEYKSPVSYNFSSNEGKGAIPAILGMVAGGAALLSAVGAGISAGVATKSFLSNMMGENPKFGLNKSISYLKII